MKRMITFGVVISMLALLAGCGVSKSTPEVSDYLGNGERIVYINVLNNISIDCDCDGNPAQPDIHDIGILASFDPVAIDQASIDLAFAAEGSESLQNRVNGRDGLHTLEHAEEIGLGSCMMLCVP